MSALDPALLYFVSGTVAYLASGSTFLRPLMPRIGPVSFMPSTRAVLGELGAESYYDVIARVEGGPAALAYYRSGGNLHDRLRGAGLELHGVELGGHEGSFRADYWRDGRAGEHRFHLSVGSTVPVESSGRTALTAEIGYKTRGLLMGKPIGAGLYGYLGTRLSLRYDR